MAGKKDGRGVARTVGVGGGGGGKTAAATAKKGRGTRAAAKGRGGRGGRGGAKRQGAAAGTGGGAGAADSKARVRAKRAARRVPRHVARVTRSSTKNLRAEIMQYMDAGGYLSWSAKKKKYQILGTNMPKDGLVACPECGIGQLVVIRSPKTRKRFIGCSNYHNGCKASSPLLQRAMLKVTKSPCRACSWPVMVFRFSRTQPWTRRCSNTGCAHRDPAGGGGGNSSSSGAPA